MSDEHIIISRIGDVATYHEEPVMDVQSMASEIKERRDATQAYLDALDAWDTARFSSSDMDRHAAAARLADALVDLRAAHGGGR